MFVTSLVLPAPASRKKNLVFGHQRRDKTYEFHEAIESWIDMMFSILGTDYDGKSIRLCLRSAPCQLTGGCQDKEFLKSTRESPLACLPLSYSKACQSCSQFFPSNP